MDLYSQTPPGSRDMYGDFPGPPPPLPPSPIQPGAPASGMYGEQRLTKQAPLQATYGSATPQQQQQQYQQQQQQQALQADLTQEDYLFLKKWKNDCLFQRTIPLITVTCGAQYYYNHVKQLPHSWIRYASLVATSYFVGIFSFRNEFRRRIATSPSNTPFMQKARASLGLPAIAPSGASASSWSTQGGYETPMNAGPDAAIGLYSSDAYSVNPPLTDGSGNMGIGYQENLNADWTNDNTVNSPISPYATPSPITPSNMEHFNPLPPSNPVHLGNETQSGSGGGGLTYDEIRARNRGLIR